jgi:hypothetical protein
MLPTTSEYSSQDRTYPYHFQILFCVRIPELITFLFTKQNGKWQEYEKSLELDMPRIVATLRQDYLPPVTFTLPPPRNLICYFCFDDLTHTGSWRIFADHYKGHAHAKRWKDDYGNPFSNLWRELFNHFLVLGTNIEGCRDTYLKYLDYEQRIKNRGYSQQYRVRSAGEIESSDDEIICNPQPARPLNLLPPPPPSQWPELDDFLPDPPFTKKKSPPKKKKKND